MALCRLSRFKVAKLSWDNYLIVLMIFGCCGSTDALVVSVVSFLIKHFIDELAGLNKRWEVSHGLLLKVIIVILFSIHMMNDWGSLLLDRIVLWFHQCTFIIVSFLAFKRPILSVSHIKRPIQNYILTCTIDQIILGLELCAYEDLRDFCINLLLR